MELYLEIEKKQRGRYDMIIVRLIPATAAHSTAWSGTSRLDRAAQNLKLEEVLRGKRNTHA